MGQRYADIVESCLTCLDKTNPDFGNEKEFMDEDGVLVKFHPSVTDDLAN